MAAARRIACVLSQRDSTNTLYTRINGVTGNVSGSGSLEAVASSDVHMVRHEMSYWEISQALDAGSYTSSWRSVYLTMR